MNSSANTTSRSRCSVAAVALTLSLSLFFTGCTSLQTVPLTGVAGPTVVVRPGDEVQVQTKDGQVHTFKVTAIESDALAAGQVRIRYDAMATLRVRRLDKSKTALVVVVAVAVAAGAAFIASHSMFSGPLFPPGTVF